MRTSRITPFLLTLSVLFASVADAQAATAPPAQPPATGASAPSTPAAMGDADIKSFAALHVAIALVHDSSDAQLAESRNKTGQAQAALREKLRKDVASLISKSGLTDAEYSRRRYLVSTDGETRKKFDAAVATLTGQPLPGSVPVVATPVATIAVPPGAAGVHVGHVVNAFMDTPNSMGLLPVALAEARVAAQHATLATRGTTDLAAMKLHAGHVLHALDPSVVTTGPGRGYGLLRASAGIASHIELAAKAEGAPPGVTTHAPHIAAAARATGARADAIIAIAKKIQAATEASEAATLVTQMASLCDALLAGADLNSDGRIGVDGGEGGLQMVQQHVGLLLGSGF
jgi:hypothetical protein